MRCETCGGTGRVWIVNPFNLPRATYMQCPCPELDCHNGHRHCCDGGRCQPEQEQPEGDA